MLIWERKHRSLSRARFAVVMPRICISSHQQRGMCFAENANQAEQKVTPKPKQSPPGTAGHHNVRRSRGWMCGEVINIALIKKGV